MRATALFASLLTLTAFLEAAPVQAQRTWLDQALQPTSKAKAAYYKEPAGEADGRYKARILDLGGKLKAEGEYFDQQLRVENGHFTFYHPDGKVESTGDYAMGNKSGVWQRFDKWGQALAEKVYDAKPLENIVYTMAQTMPRYPGGEQAMVKYLKDRCGKGVSGATAAFVVEKDGSLSGIKVFGADDDNEAASIAQALVAAPRWEAGSNEGLPVRVQMRVPLK
ncbi:MAG: hypothetical protein QM724_06220 [Flavobacteriales bacterium]